MDNRLIERLWKSVKYEDVYVRNYLDALALGRGLGSWFRDYNNHRPHEVLNHATHGEVDRDQRAHGSFISGR